MSRQGQRSSYSRRGISRSGSMGCATSAVSRARHRGRVAVATLVLLALLVVVLACLSNLSPRVGVLQSLGSPVDERGISRQDAVRELVFPCENFDVTGFSENPVIIGFSVDDLPEVVSIEVNQAMQSAGWRLMGEAGASVRSYIREPVQLWDGVELSTAVVSIHDLEGDATAIVIELL
jgi:hypothetical protein